MVRNMRRDDLFKKKEAIERDFGVAFMTGFTRQHKQVEKIIYRHWHLLLKDADCECDGENLTKQPTVYLH